MAELNLCKLLKGHEGEYFYSPFWGLVRLQDVLDEEIVIEEYEYGIPANGILYSGGECVIYPSKDCRDWSKWAGNRPDKEAKIWSDLEYCNVEVFAAIKQLESNGPVEPICKSALALLKINELIEAGYGGVPSYEEKLNGKTYYVMTVFEDENTGEPIFDVWFSNPVHTEIFCFHTEEQAKEFLKHPENIQLLKDYYMMSRL